MSVTIQDNFNLAAAKAVDNRYEKLSSGGVSIPYTNVSEVYTAIPSVYRHRGLTVAVEDGSGGIQEYWWKNGTTNPDLVPKSGAVTNANNGLSVVGGFVKLGGALTQTTTDITGVDQSLNFYLNSGAGDRYTQFLSNKFYCIIQSGDLPNTLTSPGSTSRAVIFKSTASLLTNNYSSYAYEAQTRWNNAHPWAIVNPNSPQEFQIYDNFVSTNQNSVIISHYYDERVGSPAWQDTWTGGHTLVAGKVYTLRTKESGDNFPGTIGTTISGTPNTSGWIFTSNGSQPTIWTNGSTVDGDYPVIDVDPKFSAVACQVGDTPGDYAGLGIVYIEGNGLLVNNVIDQRASTRGLILGRFNSGTRPKSSTTPLKQGELFYNTSFNRLEFFISASGGNDTWGVVTNVTTTYPS